MSQQINFETTTGPVSELSAELDRDAIIKALLEVAQAAFLLLDDCCEEQMEGLCTVEKCDVEFLSAALDKLDELPDDKPGCTMDGPGRARWALLGA